MLWTSPRTTQPQGHQDGDATGPLSPTWCLHQWGGGSAGWEFSPFPSLVPDQLLMMSPDLLKKSVNYSAPHQGN